MARKIQIDLEAGTAQFISGTDKAADALERFRHRADETRGVLTRLREGFELGFALEAGRQAFEALETPLEKVKESFEQVGQIGRDALKLGISAQDMSRFEHAANSNHVAVESLTTAIDHLNRELGKVASGDQGAKAAAEALKKLNLSTSELLSMNPADSFRKVSEALSHTSNTYERAAITQDLFGRGGRELIPLMSRLEDSMREADAIGFTRTKQDIENVEEGERNLAQLIDTIKGALMDLAASDWAKTMIRSIRDVVAEFRSMFLDLKTRVHAVRGAMSELDEASTSLNKKSVPGEDPITAQMERVEALKHALEAMRTLYNTKTADMGDFGKIQIITAGDIAGTERRLELNEMILSTLRKQAEAHKEAREAGERASKALAEAHKRNFESASKELEGLILKSRQLGESESSKLFAKFEHAGLSKADIDRGLEAQKRIEEFDKQQERLRRAAELYHDAETPLERYNDRMKELNDLLQHGALSHQQYAEAADKAKKDLEKSTKHPTDKDHLAENVTRRFTFDLPGKQRDAADQSLQLQKQNTQIFQQWNVWFQQMWNQAVNNVGGATNSDIAAAFA